VNRFADMMEGLGRRAADKLAADEELMKTLDALDAGLLRSEEREKKPHVRLPYSSDPRSFEKPWK
jgi:hypothetical protein